MTADDRNTRLRARARLALIIKWDGEIGDIGPGFPELEKELFGNAKSRNADKEGVDFTADTRLYQDGLVQINPVASFETVGLHPAMLKNVQLSSYDISTPIQRYCLPAIHLGYDVIAIAQTGSGKIAAFLIPIINKLMGKVKNLTAPPPLHLRPNPAVFKLGIDKVRAEPLVVTVCPSRGLKEELYKIMAGGEQEDTNITFMLFSATFPKASHELAKAHMADTHNIIEVHPSWKGKALMDLVNSYPPARTIIFVNSEHTAEELDDSLYDQEFPCTSLHSRRTQHEHEAAMRRFWSGKSTTNFLRRTAVALKSTCIALVELDFALAPTSGDFNDNDFEEDVAAGGYADDAGNCDNGMALEMIGVVRLTTPPLSRSPTPLTAGEGA
ncbi:uncharacterized protein CTHT_0012670 [Thermochaetoides thermophila DSM 1495]|uniref:RNA helicase n=1 Tax=Chaetomium thermophilum (strain DSM 1495 / CBS 144.50 / IMI 039719) TaxID=759272 RepID=G0S182_CHATD|nr:hypothetical protein CTHT_0012670 [Thermochaetoides thermophila DSM 1495]EGS22792.1 hypothetical protein CTHT_0012670 [Thermochaetoides thermophila DSM 1495]